MDKIIIFTVKFLGSITLILVILAILLIISTFVIRSILSHIKVLKYLQIYNEHKNEIDEYIKVTSDIKLYLKIRRIIENRDNN